MLHVGVSEVHILSFLGEPSSLAVRFASCHWWHLMNGTKQKHRTGDSLEDYLCFRKQILPLQKTKVSFHIFPTFGIGRHIISTHLHIENTLHIVTNHFSLKTQYKLVVTPLLLSGKSFG